MKPNENIEIRNFLNAITGELTFSEARTSIEKEVQAHLQDHIETGKSYGLTEPEAISESIKRMGSPYEIGKSLNLIHQPKFDFVMPALSIGLCLVGLWNLSVTKWMGLQLVWLAVGFLIVTTVYILPIARFKKMLSVLYGLAMMGLAASYFSGVMADGQNYLSIFGLNVKIVDLSAVLFALGLPALASHFRGLKYEQSAPIALFLIPMAYFSLNGFIWGGLLVSISGLCFLGMQKISNLLFVSIGVVSTGLMLSKFSDGFAPISDVNRAIVDNAHTDYALHSLNAAVGAEIIALTLLVSLLMYGFRRAFAVKESDLRCLSLVSMALLATQIVASISANLGILPMISAGVNIPFVSYGGSGIVANCLLIAVLLACLKRRTLTLIDA